MDSGGNVVSQFAFQPGSAITPSAAVVDAQGNLWIVGSTLSTEGRYHCGGSRQPCT
jgi:hypothetical protein